MDVAELKRYDVNLRWRGCLSHRREIVVVDISEKTLDELGCAWPFPRAVFAEAIEHAQAAKPKALGLDLPFTEESVLDAETTPSWPARCRSTRTSSRARCLSSDIEPRAMHESARREQNSFLPADRPIASRAGIGRSPLILTPGQPAKWVNA